MVFIHGESFEWNSGNAYDGCALASYGHVVVVTFNFRLGILGFLRPVVNQDTIGNFGLLDQIAALQWVQENIAAFGGDPGSVTIMGHGTGAACANYLLVSPVTEKVQGLFHRAILMSGTALSDWALTRNPIDYTIQVAHALNCPATAELLTCLRKKRLKEIMNITVHASQFITPFGPVVDGNTVPNEPKPLMGKYNDLFSRYELLYGVTQLESLPLLDPVALQFGQNKEQRYQVLRDYLKERYPVQPDIAVASTLQAYTSDWGRHMESTEHRNMVLDILTDARVASPIIQTANYHCIANPKSYLYVFTHRSQFGYYSETTLERSVHGEELPYVFGLPIDGGDQQPHHFSEEEELLAEAVVTYWTNFAKTGNPNAPHRTSFLSQTFRHWVSFDVQWPEYDRVNQSYLEIGIPPKINRHYRGQEMKFWNKILPETLNQSTATPSYPLYPIRPERPPWEDSYLPPPPPPRYKPTPPPPPPFVPETPRYPPPPKRYPPTIPPPRKSTLPTKDPNDGYVIDPPSIVDEKQTSNLADSSSVALTIVIIIGVCFLLVNLCAFAALYYKRDKLKVQEELMKRKYEDLRLNDLEDDDDVYMKGRRRQEQPDSEGKDGKKKKKIFDSGVGGLGDDDYEAIRSAGKTLESTGGRGHEGRIVLGSSKPGEDANVASGGASGSGMKKWALSRQCSASTIDPNTKVREWIAHEVIQRCSPRFNRRMMKTPQLQMQPSTSIDTSIDKMSYQQHQPHTSPHPILVHTPKPVVPMNTLQRSKAKKISVAVDATPAARSASLQKQLSTEQHMSKSMDELGTCVSTSSITLRKPALKRSATTVEDLTTPTMSNAPSSRSTSPRDITRRSTTNINLQMYPQVTERQGSSEALNINHQHSKSDPITSPFRENDPQRQIYPHVVNITLESKGAMPTKQVRPALKKNASVTTDSSEVINVTSRDSGDEMKSQASGDPLTNIQRRNFPKVLPDFPQEESTTCDVNDGDDRELSPVQAATAKRRSLPSNSHLLVGLLPPVYESGSASQPTTPTTPVQSFKEFQQQFSAKVPPPPPPRVSSTLGRKPSNTSPLSPPSPSVVIGPPRSPTSGQPRPEPRVVIKPTIKSPITGKAPIKTKNNQPIPRVTPNNPDALLTQPPPNQHQRRQPPMGQSVSTAAGPASIPKGEITVRPVGGKIQQKVLQEKVVGSEKSSTSTSTSSELDDSSSNTGTVKRVKKPGTPGTPAKETSTQPQDNTPGTQHPPKNWYTKYNKSFLSKSKDKD